VDILPVHVPFGRDDVAVVAFMRAAGIVHVFSSRFTSDHVADTTSLVRVAVMMRNSKANRTVGAGLLLHSTGGRAVDEIAAATLSRHPITEPNRLFGQSDVRACVHDTRGAGGVGYTLFAIAAWHRSSTGQCGTS
jgi:hypothetical protein